MIQLRAGKKCCTQTNAIMNLFSVFFIFSARLCEKISVYCNATFSSCKKKRNSAYYVASKWYLEFSHFKHHHHLYYIATACTVFNVLFYLISMVLFIFFDSVAFDYEKYSEKITLFIIVYKGDKDYKQECYYFFSEKISIVFRISGLLDVAIIH